MHLRIVISCGAVALRRGLLRLIRHRRHQRIVDCEMLIKLLLAGGAITWWKS